MAGTPQKRNRLTTAVKWVAGCIFSLPLLALLFHRGGAPQPPFQTPIPTSVDERVSSAVVLDVTQRMLAEGRAQETIALLKSALLKDPGSPLLYNNLCVAHGLLKERTLAILACETALKLAPDLQLARSNLAWVSSISEGPQ